VSDTYPFKAALRALEKTASNARYMRDRQRILAAAAAYRLKNKDKIKRKKRKYQRELKSGVRKQTTRYAVGNSYVFGGIR
jgi:hypothetical protein